MINCGKITRNLTLTRCEANAVGIEPEVILINHADIESVTRYNGMITVIQLINGRVGYRFDTLSNGVEANSTMKIGDYAARFSHAVSFRAFSKTQELKDQINAMANGRFVAIVKNTNPDIAEPRYEVYGIENGLVMTSCEAASTDADGVVYAVTIESSQGGEENELPSTFYNGSAERTEADIALLLGLYIDVVVSGSSSSPVTFLNQTGALYNKVKAIEIEGTIYPREFYHTFNDNSRHTVRIFLSGVPTSFNNAFSRTAIRSIDFYNMEEVRITDMSYMFHNCNLLSSVDLSAFYIAADNTTSRTFYGCSALTSVSLPMGITTIGDWAFRDCGDLLSIDIPDSVTQIGARAFQNCYDLTRITIPENVTQIGANVFYGCRLDALIFKGDFVSKDYTFDTRPTLNGWSAGGSFGELRVENATKIGAYAFRNCASLQTVVLSENVKTISQSAFGGCSTLKSIQMGGVRDIGDYAFIDCTALASVTLSHSLTKLGTEVFRRCTALRSLTIPESVQTESALLCDDCTSLQTVNFNAEAVGYSCFSDCVALESVSLGDKVTKLEHWAFARCSALHSITIPDKVNYVGAGAFHSCTNLERVVFTGAVPAFGVDSFLYTSPNLTIQVPSQYLSNYKQALPQFNIVTY